MVLARTDRSRGPRGLSLLVVEKPRGEASGFLFTQDDKTRSGTVAAGRLEVTPIDTIKYRGMQSYELALENWWVPDDALIEGEDGESRGFCLQMESFENGRLQTAARAIGAMQATYEGGLAYSRDRKAFGQSIFDYQLTRAAHPGQSSGGWRRSSRQGRRFAYRVAGLMACGEGYIEASMMKAYARSRRVGDARVDAGPRRHGLRRGVRGEPPICRRPGADFRGRGRGPLPQGDSPPASSNRRSL